MDGRYATLHLPDTVLQYSSKLWPLGGKPAIMCARYCCFALRGHSGAQCMLFWRHFGANCTNMEIILFAK